MFNLKLNNPLVTEFEFDDRVYNIDLSFDNVLDVMDIIKDNSLQQIMKIALGLSFFIDIDIPDELEGIQVIEFVGEQLEGVNVAELWEFIFDSFVVEKNEEKIIYDQLGNKMEFPKDERSDLLIDVDKDADYIFSSFMQAYRINLLREQGNYTWQEFKALLNGLPEETIMKQIVKIRAWKPDKGTSNEEINRMRTLQAEYSLEEE